MPDTKTQDRIPNERLILLLLFLAQFVNILEFMMVMPLGPDFSKAVGIPLSKLGWVGSSYTFAAALAGIGGMFLLGRVPRKKALMVTLAGMSIGTFCGGLAQNAVMLLGSRVVAGIFGGPATSAAMGLVADHFPEHRRGKAMGAVISAFSVAAVAGVPISLQLSLWGGWRVPFFAVGILAFLVAVGVGLAMPPKNVAMPASRAALLATLKGVLKKKRVWLAYIMTSVAMFSGFLLIPNLAAYVQGNLAFPREQMGQLYLCGGILSFAAIALTGRLVDHFGSFAIGGITSGVLILLIYGFFYRGLTELPTTIVCYALFVTFMPLMSARNVALHTLNSKVPEPMERSIFMSALSTINSTGSASGAFVASMVLSQTTAGILENVPLIAAASMVCTALLVPLMGIVELKPERVLRRPEEFPGRKV